MKWTLLTIVWERGEGRWTLLPSKHGVCGPASASVGLVLAAAAQQRLIDACGKPLQGHVALYREM